MVDFFGAKKYILDRLGAELPSNLYYHGIHHTLDVYRVSTIIADLEKISDENTMIVNTAALYHDAGFMYRYLNNEVLAVGLVYEVLPDYGYSEKQIKRIGNIILTTKIKIKPRSLLQKIVCDADYDYLGREENAEIADSLYRELAAYGFSFSEKEWHGMQIEFLNKHEYYTKSSILLRREKKWAYLRYLKKQTV